MFAALVVAAVAPVVLAAPVAADTVASTQIKKVGVTITPSEGEFGVGQLITAEFSAPVEFKAEAEAKMQVTGDRPLPPGAWGWIDDSTAVYRPKEFWPAHTALQVTVDLRDVTLKDTTKTTWVGGARASQTVDLRTGRSFIARIDAQTKRMRVYIDDRRVKVFKVSLGKPTFPTRSGIKIIEGEKYRKMRMTSEQLGSPYALYDLKVPYAVRLTASGEFVHGAPWAEYRLGRWNGSHGCTNVDVASAKWFFEEVQPGDVTVTTNTGVPMETTDGAPGALWNYSWRQWQTLSALG